MTDQFVPEVSYSRRLARVVKHVESCSDRWFSRKEAAAIAGLEARYFSRFFPTHTGVTFHVWNTAWRIRRAQALFAQHNYSVSEVAVLVGYRDLGTFRRAFKRTTNMTPRAFKRSLRAPLPLRPDELQLCIVADGFDQALRRQEPPHERRKTTRLAS